MINEFIIEGKIFNISATKTTRNNKDYLFIEIAYITNNFNKEYQNIIKIGVFDELLINNIKINFQNKDKVTVKGIINNLEEQNAQFKLTDIKHRTIIPNNKQRQKQQEQHYKQEIQAIKDKHSQTKRAQIEQLTKEINILDKMDNDYFQNWVMTDEEKDSYRKNYLKMNDPYDEAEYTKKKQEQQVLD